MPRNMIATERLPGGEMRLEMKVTVSMEIFQEIMAAVAKENPPAPPAGSSASHGEGVRSQLAQKSYPPAVKI
jgi:hypothetical protein